ncbi:hypothetical protein F4778DRAFT_777485 [Xylariomycetidae sp. FL2044]|nr:hypothetical protein F4778DRAFT_777485 [Xylariomycetidae sp. FL2044]
MPLAAKEMVKDEMADHKSSESRLDPSNWEILTPQDRNTKEHGEPPTVQTSPSAGSEISGTSTLDDTTAVHVDHHESEDTLTPVPTSKPAVDKAGWSAADFLDQIRQVVKEGVSAATKEHEAGENDEQTVQSASTSFGPPSLSDETMMASPSFPTLSSSPLADEASPTSKAEIQFGDRGPLRTFAKRPVIIRRSSSHSDQPVVEWGVLVDGNGCATPRCGEVLRGLAKYIVEEYAPNQSLVITPEKMAILYSRYRIDSEVFPYSGKHIRSRFEAKSKKNPTKSKARTAIFTSDLKDLNDRIADFYWDMGCQHCLVQADARSKPRVPALTPVGFAQYLMLCILAHPDEESRRLAKIAADVQLTTENIAADGRPERLPRQFIRSLLPVKHDPEARKTLAVAMADLLLDLQLSSSSSSASVPAFPISGPRSALKGSTTPSSSTATAYPNPGHHGYSVAGPSSFSQSNRAAAADDYYPRDQRRSSSSSLQHPSTDEMRPFNLYIPPDRMASRSTRALPPTASPSTSRSNLPPVSSTQHHYHHPPSLRVSIPPPPPPPAQHRTSNPPTPAAAASAPPLLPHLLSPSSPSSTTRPRPDPRPRSPPPSARGHPTRASAPAFTSSSSSNNNNNNMGHPHPPPLLPTPTSNNALVVRPSSTTTTTPRVHFDPSKYVYSASAHSSPTLARTVNMVRSPLDKPLSATPSIASSSCTDVVVASPSSSSSFSPSSERYHGSSGVGGVGSGDDKRRGDRDRDRDHIIIIIIGGGGVAAGMMMGPRGKEEMG